MCICYHKYSTYKNIFFFGSARNNIETYKHLTKSALQKLGIKKWLQNTLSFSQTRKNQMYLLQAI